MTKTEKRLLDVIKNALTSVAIINIRTTEGLGDVATDKQLLEIMADSFRNAIAETEQ